MQEQLLKVSTAITILRMVAVDKVRDDRGEGVVSVAIAVLIMAALGAIAWVIFEGVINDAGTRTQSEISNIG